MNSTAADNKHSRVVSSAPSSRLGKAFTASLTTPAATEERAMRPKRMAGEIVSVPDIHMRRRKARQRGGRQRRRRGGTMASEDMTALANDRDQLSARGFHSGRKAEIGRAHV